MIDAKRVSVGKNLENFKTYRGENRIFSRRTDLLLRDFEVYLECSLYASIMLHTLSYLFRRQAS